MIGDERCGSRSPGSEDGSLYIECEEFTHSDRSSEYAARPVDRMSCSDNSLSSRRTSESDSEPETIPAVSPKLSPVDQVVGDHDTLPNAPGACLSKLESLVNNLLKAKKNQASPAKSTPSEFKPYSPMKSDKSYSSPRKSGFKPYAMIPQRENTHVVSATQIKPTIDIQPQFSMSNKLPASEMVPTMPSSLPSSETVPTSSLQLPTSMPMHPAMMGMPAAASMSAFPAFPYMSPFGMPGFMPMPGMPMGMMPMMPQMTSLPSSATSSLSIDTKPNVICIKPDPDASGCDDMPLDLSMSKKRKLDLDSAPEPYRPLKITAPVKPQPVSAYNSPMGPGLLQIRVPQSIKPPTPSHPARLLSPKPGILNRNGSSAFTAIASPASNMQTQNVSPQHQSPPSSPDGSTSSQSPGSSNHSPGGATGSPSGIRNKEISVYEHNVLQTEFLESAKDPQMALVAKKLQQKYRHEVDRIEMQRHQATSTPDIEEIQRTTINSVYDNQRLLLAREYKLQLSQETYHVEVKSEPNANVPKSPEVSEGLSENTGNAALSRNSGFPSNPSMPFMPLPGMPFPGMFPGMPMPHMMFPMPGQMMPFTPNNNNNNNRKLSPVSAAGPNATSTPAKVLQSTNENQISPNSSFDSNTDSSSPTEGEEENHRGTKRKFLSQHAVVVLTEWYEGHFDHPYPDDQTVDDLAIRSRITQSQVKKWMANKRVRSCNTLAFNGSIHPKKLQKLMQLKENGSTMTPVPMDNCMSPLSSAEGSILVSEGKKSKRNLDPRAVEYMNNWYFEHINYPYPTEAEKNRIASDAGLSISQVTCWFANKRNRSNNTRKISTKVMWQKLNQKMSYMDNMGRSSDSGLPTMVPLPQPMATNMA